MKDYYTILDIPHKLDKLDIQYKMNIDDEIDIKAAYKIKISRFKNLPFLTKKMINDIKDIKEAYYVLSDSEKKEKYNNIFKKIKQKDDTKYIEPSQICNRLFSLTNHNHFSKPLI
jgi:DnaJ-class molecular chaperone